MELIESILVLIAVLLLISSVFIAILASRLEQKKAYKITIWQSITGIIIGIILICRVIFID